MSAITFDDVIARMADVLSLPAERLTPGTTLAELVTDSFLLVEMAVDLQEEFGVLFNESDVKDLHTVGDVVSLLQGRAS